MEAVANAWETVDWERLQTKIEAEIEALGVRQDDSEERRKRLVEESNGYRERTNKETRKVAVPLIKAFQQEFDGLIARSQLAESALIDICSQITNLPDPKSLLKGAEAWKSDADKTKRAVEEREQLKKKLQETQNELAELKNSDAEVQKLKTKLTKQEIEHEKLIDDAIDQAERRIRDELDQRLDEMSMKNERQRLENEQLEKKLAEMETKHREVGRKLDVAKIINNQKESLDDEQLQIAVKDLNDANHRIVVLEEKIAELTSELDIAMSSNQIGQPKSNGITDLAAFGELMIEKDEQIKKMNEEMTEMERRNGEEMKKWKEKVANLEKDQKRQNAQIEELKGQLEARQDYEAIKKELRLLREIEFGESLDSNADNQISVDSVETLDKLLAEKNRRLQNEKANLRVMNEGFKDETTIDDEMISMTTTSRRPKRESTQIKIEPIDISPDPEEEEEEEEEPALDLLALLRKIKNETMEKTSTPSSAPSTIKHATHTITTTELPPRRTGPPKLDEIDLKLNSMGGSPSTTKPINNGSTSGESDKYPNESQTVENMQARIHENVRQLGARSLNTMEIARQCKRLMVSYNIGQRLFAKHVMNQVVKSQGSLSELLSKPRHWNKLTDKGREAFRRIYGWISDDLAIEMLCSLSPRRVWPSDQKIEHPKAESLWEVNSTAIAATYEDAKENPLKAASAREDQYRLGGSSSSSRQPPSMAIMASAAAAASATSGTMPIRSSRWRHDDISKEKIMSIFQTELAKLKEQESNIEKAVGGKPSLSPLPSSRRLSNAGGDVYHSPEKFRTSTVEKVMKSRVNSGLLAVTQQQYDSFPNIDTDQLVKQIKEFLTVNSISQRQFGEHVLGLSQGSVSDLLARPKTWHQLTQKGREPFIRMRMFMDDVAEQADSEDSQRRQQQQQQQVERVDSIRVLDEDSELAKTLASILNGQQRMEEEKEEKKAQQEDFTMKEIKLEPEPLSEIDLIMQVESGSNLEGLVKYVDDNGQEVLDTYELVFRIRKMLQDNAVSCRVFTDYYLKCSPNMCADIFLRTKPFENLKPIEKEVYARMKRFINDRQAMMMLIEKEATRDAPKDKYDAIFQSMSNQNTQPPAAPRAIKRKASSDNQDEDYEPKKPIHRTIITDFQKDVLRFVFINEQHPSQEMCESLANRMEMSVRTVQNWFHNHRTRSKAREKEGKVYSDALPTDKHAVKSVTWRADLEEMLSRGPALTQGSSSTSTSSNGSNGSNSPAKWSAPDVLEPKDLVSSLLSKIKASNQQQQQQNKSRLIVGESPTMVSIMSNNNNNNNTATSTTPQTTVTKKKSLIDLLSAKKTGGSGGQLDKLVAKMRQIAEGKEAAANGV